MKTLNRIFLVIVAMAASFVVASCSNDNTVNEASCASFTVLSLLQVAAMITP